MSYTSKCKIRNVRVQQHDQWQFLNELYRSKYGWVVVMYVHWNLKHFLKQIKPFKKKMARVRVITSRIPNSNCQKDQAANKDQCFLKNFVGFDSIALLWDGDSIYVYRMRDK